MKRMNALLSAVFVSIAFSSSVGAEGQGNPVDLAVLNSLNVEMGSEVDQNALDQIMDMQGLGQESLSSPDAMCEMAANMITAAELDPGLMAEVVESDNPVEVLTEAMGGDAEAAETLIAGLESTGGRLDSESSDSALDECFISLATNE